MGGKGDKRYEVLTNKIGPERDNELFGLWIEVSVLVSKHHYRILERPLINDTPTRQKRLLHVVGLCLVQRNSK